MIQFLISYLSEFSIALLGAGTLWASNRLYRAYINQKYKISGRYISRYYDIIDGKECIDKTHAKLKQKGYHIIGKDFHKDGRVWNLKGEFINKKYLSGVYFAESMHDLGTGSFFFDYDGRDLDGLWSGYDNVNNQVISGSYKLTRMLSVDISRLEGNIRGVAVGMAHSLNVSGLLQGDEIQALRISDGVLGRFYLNRGSFSDTLGRMVLLGAYEGRELIGFAIAYSLLAGTAEHVVWPNCEIADKGSDVLEADHSGSLGCIKIVAVREKSQGRGVGTQLIKHCERQLRKLGATVVIVPTWRKPDGVINIGGVLHHSGYEIWRECQLFWQKDCDSSNFECPVRGADASCQCDMVIFKRIL
jgi:GNAT superfamily N-acetyltransferase